MKAKHPKAVHTIMFVPNDAEGNEFLRLVRRYLNREHYTMRLQGRNPDRQSVRAPNQSKISIRTSLRKSQSTTFALYLQGKTTERMDKKTYKKFWESASQAWRLQQEVNRLALELERATTKPVRAMRLNVMEPFKRKIREDLQV